MRRSATRKQDGFTIVELVTVVTVLGIILTIALPNFMMAREISRTNSCVSNLRALDIAVLQYAMDNKLDGAAHSPSVAALIGPAGYINTTPVCPIEGTYSLGLTISDPPTCSIGLHGTGDYGPSGRFYHGLPNLQAP